MNYVSFGLKKNPAIIFLHGWGGSVDSWIYCAKNFAYLGFYCVVIDFPGFGKSAEPNKPYSIYDYASEVENLIKALGLNHVSVVGHSFGGRVSIVLGANKNISINKIVLVDSAGVIPRRGMLYRIKIRKYKKIKKMVAEGKLSSDVLDKFGSSDYRLLSPVMKETFIRVVNEDLLKIASSIKSKTILIWGRFDKDTPLYMAKKLKKAIIGSRLTILPAGHYSYVDCYQMFADELYSFLIS